MKDQAARARHKIPTDSSNLGNVINLNANVDPGTPIALADSQLRSAVKAPGADLGIGSKVQKHTADSSR